MAKDYFPYERQKVEQSPFIYEKDKEKKIATLTFNKPEKLNSLTLDEGDEYVRQLWEVNDDDDVKVLILKGAGRCFGTGHDVNILGRHIGFKPEDKSYRPPIRKRMVREQYIFGPNHPIQATLNCLKIVIAQIHGYCYGLHFEIATVSDLAIASEDAQFTHPGLSFIGANESSAAMWLEVMGFKKLNELVFIKRPFTAQEACECGLVNKFVPKDKLDEVTMEYAETAANSSAIDLIVSSKSFIRANLHMRGVYAGFYTAALAHSGASHVRFEPGEFNLFKTRAEGGLKAVSQKREEMVAPEFRARKPDR